MKVTFPHMGSLWVPFKTLLDKHGIDSVVPPMFSKHTMSLGVKYSPEWMCLPYKVLLGNIIEGLEQGADTVMDVRGPGLCRLGYYAKLHEDALRDMGYQFTIRAFDWQADAIIALAKFIKDLLPGNRSWRVAVGALKFAIQQLSLMEEIERKVHFVRPREVRRGEATRVWRAAGERVCAAHSPAALKKAREGILGELDAIPLDPGARPLRVSILGEFYVILNPFCNMDLEDELGKRGVEVTRSAWLTEWVKAWLFLEWVGLGHGRKVKRAAQPYLSRDVSGDAVQALGETILHKEEGFEGILHLYPFTCMPEIIAENIYPKLIKDHSIPVLTIVFDEQMARAGLVTRIEAFIDLMERRRTKAGAARAG
ncbi:MAG TPA: CoA protein activase [Dehalococcoidia bacterium]|nr:CoA protein activase [Dehalococcoidia bacterium]